MNYLCTFFDKRYLAKGVALYSSLLAQGAPFHLWVLCMDRETEEDLSSRRLPNVILVTVSDLERNDPRVMTTLQNRSLVEFYFTSKPIFCTYIFDKFPDVDLITYIDADCYFFGSPEVIREEMKDYSIGLTAHRFPSRLKYKEQYGLFNAGFVSFRRDTDGIAALTWWRSQCITSCHDYVDHGRFADQGYLNDIPKLFKRVVVIEHMGINAAPWNVTQSRIRVAEGLLLIYDDPLIFYHFHGVTRLGIHWYDSGLSAYGVKAAGRLIKHIYRPYIEQLVRLGDALPGHRNRDIRFDRGVIDWFSRLFPSLGHRLQLARRISSSIIHRSLIVYRETKRPFDDQLRPDPTSRQRRQG